MIQRLGPVCSPIPERDLGTMEVWNDVCFRINFTVIWTASTLLIIRVLTF